MNKQKYENLEELLKEVKATGMLDTSIDFIVHVQDLIGNSDYETLDNLSHEYKETFYRVYDEAEGIETTLRFFATYSAFAEKYREAETDRDKFEFLYNDTKKTLDKTADELKEVQTRNKNNLKDLVLKQQEIDELKTEIMQLKAKLYDLVTA